MINSRHQIDWLFDTEQAPSDFDSSIKKIEFPYPPGLATGFSEHLEIYEGITLIRSTHIFNNEDRPPEILLGNFKVDFSSTTFASHIMHSGILGQRDKNKNIYAKRMPGIDVFSRLDTIHLEQTVFTEEDISYSILLIPENQMLSLLGPEAFENFYKNLGLIESSDFCEVKIPKTISNSIINCMDSHLEGRMRGLFAYSTILRYILEVNIFVSSSTNFLANLERNNFDIAVLHAELLQVTGDIPRLDDLSKKYNLSAAKLNQLFTSQYNESIYSFLSNQRLDQAHRALLDTDISMKALAHKIGYSHVNHFIAAFKKKFGVTPGSIRS